MCWWTEDIWRERGVEINMEGRKGLNQSGGKEGVKSIWREGRG